MPVSIQNLQGDPRVGEPDFFRNHGLLSYVGIPLNAKGKTLGALGFYTHAIHNFTENEVQFLETLAGQIAIAIQNSQLHEKTKNQAAELEKANDVKSEFLSVMSHELRTPINVMMGYVELVQQGLLGEVKPQQNEALKKSLGHEPYGARFRYITGQVDSSAKRSHEGIGLGLFLAKKHTELLGGELRVASELGKGSTFTLTLPIH